MYFSMRVFGEAINTHRMKRSTAVDGDDINIGHTDKCLMEEAVDLQVKLPANSVFQLFPTQMKFRSLPSSSIKFQFSLNENFNI